MCKINEYINNIIGTVKFFNWKINSIYVEDNCIYAERTRANGTKVTEGLYAGSESDPEDVYSVYSKLQYIMNFNNMINNDNVLI